MEATAKIISKNRIGKSNVSFFPEENKNETKIKKILGKWEYAEIYATLVKWLQIFAEKMLCVEYLGIPHLEIVKLNPKKYSDCQIGFAANGEARVTIRMNAQHLPTLPLWQVLAHLYTQVIQLLLWQNENDWDKEAKLPIRISKHGSGFLYQTMRVGIITDKKGKHIHYGKVKMIQKKKGKWDYAPTGDPEGKFEFRDMLLAQGVDCPESYDVPTAPTEEKKKIEKRENWKTKYEELAQEVRKLREEKEQLLFSMMNETTETKGIEAELRKIDIEEPAKPKNISEDTIIFAGQEIKKEDIAPICDFVLGKITSLEKGYVEKTEIVLAVNKQFPRSETARKFGINPIKTGQDTFFVLALKMLEQEKKIERKRIVGKKVAYFIK